MWSGRRFRASINCGEKKTGQFEWEVNKIMGRGETHVQSFGPLACDDLVFYFAETEENAAAVTVDG